MRSGLHGLCLFGAYVIMLFGLAGTIVPLVPGLPLIFGTALLYGLLTDFSRIGAGPLVALALIAVFVQGCDYLAGAWGARKFGGGKWGIVGSIAGGLVGVIVFSIPGLILGTAIGATAGELAGGAKFEQSARAGLGTLVGLLAGTLVRVSAGVVMIGIFTVAVARG
jgi:uncharacterized protein YqgC (DUF456 family)